MNRDEGGGGGDGLSLVLTPFGLPEFNVSFRAVCEVSVHSFLYCWRKGDCQLWLNRYRVDDVWANHNVITVNGHGLVMEALSIESSWVTYRFVLLEIILSHQSSLMFTFHDNFLRKSCMYFSNCLGYNNEYVKNDEQHTFCISNNSYIVLELWKKVVLFKFDIMTITVYLNVLFFFWPAKSD